MFVSVMMAALLSLPVCPDWISDDSQVVAPEGVMLSEEQRVKNQLRCFTSLILPWEVACRRNNSSSYCKSKVSLWLRNNFSWQGQAPCIGQRQRRTVIINIRSYR